MQGHPFISCLALCGIQPNEVEVHQFFGIEKSIAKKWIEGTVVPPSGAWEMLGDRFHHMSLLSYDAENVYEEGGSSDDAMREVHKLNDSNEMGLNDQALTVVCTMGILASFCKDI